MPNRAPLPESETACPQCGAVPLPGSPAGHCARCLAAAALGGAGEAEDAPQLPGPDDPQPWTVLGDCELLEEIGRGGMGVVYRARQRRLGREVAVKVLRGGAFASAEARQRFRAEAENAAALRHPGIVTVHDFGEEQGVCWISMEFIAGRTLDDLTRHAPMPARAAAECVRETALAVHCAHSRGVLHRDLKPSNILVDAGGAPHIADFGIARRVEGDSFTRTGQILGSPGFTAPEQALRGEADARTDVYGLGAILYSILTSRPPFQGPTAESVLVQLREGDPLPPRSLNPSVPRDLETIVLKCLAREPARRYPTAEALADDLTRFLDGRPITARPASMLEKAWRWCRRRPAVAASLTLAVLAMTAGTVVSLALARREQEAAGRAQVSERRALASAEETRRALYAATMLRAQDDLREGSPLAAPALAGLVPAPGQTDLRGWEWHWMHSQLHGGTLRLDEKRIGEPRAVAWSPDGKRLAVSTLAEDKGRTRVIEIRDAETFAVLKTLTGYDREIPYLHWHPDNTRLLASDAGGSISVWDTANGQRLVKLAIDPAGLDRYQPPRAEWSPDGTLFAAISKAAGLTLHRAADGGLVRTLMANAYQEPAFAWHPDGDRLAVFNGPDPVISIVSVDGTTRSTLPVAEAGTCLAWSPDGTRLAAGTASARLSIFDPVNPAATVQNTITFGAIGHLLWTEDGRRVVNGGWTGVPVIVDAATGRPERYLFGHGAGWITSMARRGDRLLTWCKDATLREWNLAIDAGTRQLPAGVTRLRLCGPQQEIRADAPQASPLGRTVIRQADGGLHQDTFPWARAVAWSPDGARFAIVRNLDPGRYGLGALMKPGALIEFRSTAAPQLPSLPLPIRTDYRLHDLLWSPDGSRFLAISAGSRPPFCAVLSAADGREICRIPAAPHFNLTNSDFASAAAWSPDGKRIAIGAGSILYDAATGQPACADFTASMQRFAKEVGGPAISLAWSPDGTRLAFGFNDSGHILLTDAATGAWLALKTIHSGWVRALAFSPDGTRLATASHDTTVKLLDAATLKTLLIFKDHAAKVCAVAWSDDGRTLASADTSGLCILRRL